MNGGCDHAYAASSCVWGTEPEPLLERLGERVPLRGLRVLDAGCGEGRNAVYLGQRGARVRAVDVSAAALANAAAAWPDATNVTWERADVQRLALPLATYDLVVVDSVLHWLVGEREMTRLVHRLRAATRPGGLHLMCAFNDRHQELEGHDRPPTCIASHAFYLDLYDGWRLLEVRDEVHRSAHPGAPHEHGHSVTKLVARREDGAP